MNILGSRETPNFIMEVPEIVKLVKSNYKDRS